MSSLASHNHRADSSTIKELMKRLGGKDNSPRLTTAASLGNDRSPNSPTDTQASSSQVRLETELLEDLRIIMDMIPRVTKTSAKHKRLQNVEIFQVDTARTLTASIKDDRGDHHRLYVELQGKLPPAGCDCEVSDFRYPCPHVVMLVEELIDQLQRSLATKSISSTIESMLAKMRVQEFGKVSSTEQFLKPDMAARWLDGLSLHCRPADPVDHAATLPPIAVEERRGRLCWNLSTETIRDTTQLRLDVYLQTPKKRGGFTKGRKLSGDTLRFNTDLPLDELDRKLISMMELVDSGNYYNSKKEYRFSPLKSMSELIGCDRVTFESQPFEVVVDAMIFALDDRDEELKIVVAHDRQTDLGPVYFGSNVMIRVMPGEQRIAVATLSSDLIDLYRELFTAPSFPATSIDKVATALRPFQDRISLQLPTASDGPIQPHDAPLVVMLRSRDQGCVDYGIRFRDAAGHLHLPGCGPLVQSVVVKDKKWQAVRRPNEERRRATELVKKLHLAADEFGGWYDSTPSIADSLQLINQLQTIANSGDEANRIEVMWDQTGGGGAPMKFAGTISQGNVQVEITRKRNWFGVTGSATVGDQTIALADLLKNLSPADDEAIVGNYIRLADGQWAEMEQSLRGPLLDFQAATHTERGGLRIDATAAREIRGLSDAEIEIRSTAAWEKCLLRLADSESADPLVPAGLDATLRDYQVDGFRWMSRLARWGVGGVLADDMGLGKTLQTLAVLLDRAAAGPSLVIAPTSVGFNWARETSRFAPDLNVHLYRETDRAEFLTTVGPHDLVVCSYGLAMRDGEALAGVNWNTLVLDEAQAIKNSRSKTSMAIAEIPADWTVALTGTPVENHLGELWSLFHVVSPGVFGGWAGFRDRFASPIEKEQNAKASQALAARLQPFVLRRTKAQVLTELPPRTEMNLYVDLSKPERQRYEDVRRDAIGDIKKIAKDNDVKDARFQILAAMTRLRQIACHPAMVDPHYEGPSAKLECLIATLTNLHEEGHRVLIFSQFTKHLAVIKAALDNVGITYEYLDGSTPAAARQTAVDRFQSGSADAFLISLKAGGTGLNLTAADYVIHMDPWWNPAVEDQATDRAHRMGQEKPVMVYRIVARNTIEEEILRLHGDKRDLAASVIEGTAAAAKLTNDQLIAMLSG